MLNTIELELKEKSLRTLCQTNKFFAKGVLKTLCSTDFCLFRPEKANNYSRIGFLFPLDTNEEFLECILDCVETLGEEPATLLVFNEVEKTTGYSLLIKNTLIIEQLLFSSILDSAWGKAGSVFVDFNKDKKENKRFTTINSFLFKRHPFEAVEKYNYLLL